MSCFLISSLTRILYTCITCACSKCRRRRQLQYEGWFQLTALQQVLNTSHATPQRYASPYTTRHQLPLFLQAKAQLVPPVELSSHTYEPHHTYPHCVIPHLLAGCVVKAAP